MQQAPSQGKGPLFIGSSATAPNFTTGSSWENIWRMSWPMLLVMSFNFFVGLTDVYVAGFIGPEIQAVVGFVSQLYFFIIIVANAIGIGTVALVSRAVGAGDFDKALSIARQSLLFGALCAVILTFAGLIFRDTIVSVAASTSEIRSIAGDFFLIFAFSLAPNYMVILSTAVFRSGGDVRLMLLAMSFVSAANIALNFFLVFGLFSFQGIGYRGIALSTTISMTLGMIICIALFLESRWRPIFSGPWYLSLELIRKIFSISWPAAVIQLTWSIGSLFLYNILSRLQQGSIEAMAALTNGLRIEAFIYLPVFALNMAASVLTGQNLGSGQPARAESIGWKISWIGVAFVSLVALPVFIWANPLSLPFAKNALVLAETTRYLRITMLSEPFMALSVVLGGCLQGAGDTKGAMFIIVGALLMVRLPLAYALALPAGLGPTGVWAAMVASMCCQGLAMTLRFKKGRWKDIRL